MGGRRVVIDELGRCAFAIHASRMVERFALTDEPVPNDPALPWRLAGLPLPTLPTTVDGLTVDEGMDFDRAVTQVASGWAPERAASHHRELPASWLADLYLHLNGHPLSSALAGALGRALEGGVDGERGVALCVFRRVPHAEGRERVLRVVHARGAAEAVRSSPVKYGRTGQLFFAPIDVLAAMLDTTELDRFGEEALQACGEAALAPTAHFVESHLAALARHAPGWLARNAPAVVRACPARIEGVLSQLYVVCRPDLVLSAGIALGQDPGVDRATLQNRLGKLLSAEDLVAFRRALPAI